jgi:hypothetical protein
VETPLLAAAEMDGSGGKVRLGKTKPEQHFFGTGLVGEPTLFFKAVLEFAVAFKQGGKVVWRLPWLSHGVFKLAHLALYRLEWREHTQGSFQHGHFWWELGVLL